MSAVNLAAPSAYVLGRVQKRIAKGDLIGVTAIGRRGRLHLWSVPSGNSMTPDLRYEVSLDVATGVGSCSCEATRPCTHIQLARAKERQMWERLVFASWCNAL